MRRRIFDNSECEGEGHRFPERGWVPMGDSFCEHEGPGEDVLFDCSNSDEVVRVAYGFGGGWDEIGTCHGEPRGYLNLTKTSLRSFLAGGCMPCDLCGPPPGGAGAWRLDEPLDVSWPCLEASPEDIHCPVFRCHVPEGCIVVPDDE